MRDSQHGGQHDRVGTGLSALARTVVARLIAREGGADRSVDEAVIAAISRAMLDPGSTGMDALRADLRRARISELELVDTYFPEVARYLGCAWAEDRAAFTDVTIGVARMQSMLRELGRDWTSDASAEHGGATVLIILPDGEQHSFGVMLLAGQLRRQGISVRLEVGTPAAALRKLVQEKTFDCAMISVACEEKLDHCKEVVNALKQGSHGQLWVAIGGALMGRPIDVRSRTGADIATCDPLQALQGALTEQAQGKEVTG